MALLPAIILLLQMYGLCTVIVEGSKLTFKPDFMSPERFQQLNLINLKDHLDGYSDKVTGSVRGRRMKRHVNPLKDHVLEDGDSGFLETVPVGFYKQDSLQILKIESLLIESDAENLGLGDQTNVELIKFVNYVEGDTITKLKFIVQQNSDTETVVSVEKKGPDDSTYVPIPAVQSERDFSAFINFATAPGAKISDIAMGKNTQSVFNFLCITVDWPAPYPRTPSDSVNEININDPLTIPEAAKSKLFTFFITNSGYELTLMETFNELSLTQTIGAKDCEFWVSDNMLMLGIAQTDNTQTHKPIQRSKIYYQPNVDTSEFVELIHEEDELVTYEPKRIIPFEMRGTSCIMLVNSLLSKKESPIYCYSFQNKKFELHQNLKTFGAQDAAYLHIRDTYPIYSESFMAVCNTQDFYNSQASPVPPTIFKSVKGRFIPMQTLQILETCQSVQTFSIEEDPVSVTPDHTRFTVSNLKHFVSVHTTAGNLIIYQYNGHRFVEALAPIPLGVSNYDIDVIDLSTTSTPDKKLLFRDVSGFKLFTPAFQETAFDMSTASANCLNYCLRKSQIRENTQYTNTLYHEFQYAPKLEDLASGFRIHDLEFAAGSSLSVTQATMESRDGADATNHAEVTLNIQVEDLEVITDETPASVSALKDQVVVAKATLDQLVAAVNHEDIPKLDGVNEFKGPLILVNVVGNELTGVVMHLDETSNIIENSNGETLNTVNFFANMMIISGDSIPVTGYIISDIVQFANIKIIDEYNINKLHNVLVEDYVDSSKAEETITGKVTIAVGCTFKDTVIASTINENSIDDTVLIHRSGAQTLAGLTVSGTVQFNNLMITDFNGENLNILDNALTINNDGTLGITGVLTVKTLTITGDTDTNLKVSTGSSEIGIDFNDLINNHMKIDGDNNVALKHHYTSVTSADITVPLIETSSWPDDYINIKTGTITHPGIVNLPNAESVGSITVSGKLVDSDDLYEVIIESGNVLPFVPTADETNVYTISAAKTFISGITLNAAATVNGLFQDLNPGYINNAVTIGKVVFSNPIEVSDVSIHGNIEITSAILTGGLMKTVCGNGECTTNNLNILNIGILRSVTEIINAELTFDRITFENNVNINDIDGIDPQNHFVLLDGTEERVLNDICVRSQFTFGVNLIQDLESTLTACEDNTDRKIFCKPELCTDAPDAKCELIDEECLIKTTIPNDETLCNNLLTSNIQYVMEHSLKIDEEVSISRSVFFHGGFKTDILEVRSDNCVINDVNCLSVASTTHAETFTGTNIFNGDLHISSVATIESLNAVGKVDNVLINSIYEDSLFKDSTEQTIAHLDFSENFEVLSFQSNDINIGNIEPNKLVNRDENIDRLGSDAEVLSKLTFNFDVQVNKVDAVKFNDINIDDFYNNKITLADSQVFTGTITVTNDVTFHSSVLKGSENALVNNIDIVNLDSLVVRTGGAPITLNNVAFETVVVLEPGAFIVNDKFVGVSTSDIVCKDSASIHFTADKTFTDPFTSIKGDLTFTNVQWKKSDDGVSLPTDKLIEFLDESLLVNVKFTDTLTITNEPTIVNLNGKAVETRILEVWMKSSASMINFKIEFENLLVTGQVDIPQHVINNIDIADFNNYFSISSDQSLPDISLTFSQGLVAVGVLNTPAIKLEDGVLERGIIVGDDAAIKIKELSTNAIYLSSSIIDVALTIDNSEVDELNLAADLTTNGVDLSEVAMTYPGTTVFNIPVTIASGVNIEELVASSALEFPTSRDDTQTHMGINLDGGKIVIHYDALKSNAVYNDSNADDIAGVKTFSGSMAASGISAATINGLDIGTCDSTNVLLKAPCSGDTAQTFTGRIDFVGNVNAAEVVVTNLNGEIFDDLAAKFIYKTSVDEITFSGSNTFSGGLEVSDLAVFQDLVLGANVDTLKSKSLDSVDMTYPSQIIPPDVKLLLEQVKKDSEDVPEKLLYTSRFEWKSDATKKGLIKSLYSKFDQFPFHLVGVESEGSDSGDVGELKLFKIPDDYKSRTVNKINSVKSVGISMTGESVEITSIYATQDIRLLLIKGFFLDGSFNTEKIPFITPSGANTGYMSLIKVDVSAEDEEMIVNVQEVYTGSAVIKMEPIYIDDQSCVVVCRDVHGVSILCVDETQLCLVEKQNLDNVEIPCSSVSASPADASQTTGNSFISSVRTPEEGTQEVKIYTRLDGNTEDEFQVKFTTGLPFDMETRLFSFTDPENNPVTLLILFPNLDEYLDILIYNQVSQNFEPFDSLSVVQRIKDVKFTKDGPMVEMHVLCEEINHSVLKTYSYSGFTKFSSNEAKESLKLDQSVDKVEVALTYQAEDKFVIICEETGHIDDSTPIGFINSMTDVAEIRDEFKESGQVLPQFISGDCSSMVAANLKELYSDNSYDLETVGHLFLRIMPNQHITYRAQDFSDSVADVLNNPNFQDLLKPVTPTSVANMYMYENDVNDARIRATTDETYLGSLSIYKENSQKEGETAMAYIYGRLIYDQSEASPPTYQRISFWSSCDDTADKLYYWSEMIFDATETLPKIVDDPDSVTRHQCALVHGLGDEFSNALDDLDNRDDAGAIVIHQSSSDITKPSDGYGCGYLKKPVTAKIQYLKDHNEEDIKFDPFIQYTTNL